MPSICSRSTHFQIKYTPWHPSKSRSRQDQGLKFSLMGSSFLIAYVLFNTSLQSPPTPSLSLRHTKDIEIAISIPISPAHPSDHHHRHVSSQVTVDELKSRFADLKPRYYPSRQRWTLPPKEGQRSGETLQGAKRLLDYNLGDGSVLIFKDLGPQIGYSTVFFWEYFGPLVLYPLFYLFPSVFYPWASTYVFGFFPVHTYPHTYIFFYFFSIITMTGINDPKRPYKRWH